MGRVPDEGPAIALLAVSALVGGGFLSYTAVRSIQQGGVFSVDEYSKEPMTLSEGATTGAAMLAGLYLTYEGLKEAAAEVGLEPLILGGLGVTGIAGVVWLKNR